MTAMATPRHRVSVATARMRAIVDTVADASVWSMTPAETTATLVELTRLEAQVTELKARVAEHADDETVDAWAHATRLTKPAVHGQVHLGHALAARSLVRDALAAGDLVVDQATVIVRALDQLPTDLDPDLVERAEAHLVAEARHHDARVLRILGRRLLEVVAPDQADAHEARLLEREEADALLATRLTLADDGHGTCHGRFTLPSFHGAALKKMLLAIAAPKHQAHQEPGAVRRPGPERMGRAFCELIERYPANQLPATGGVSATIVVTLETLETLEGRLEKAGLLDTGDKISPSMARRLACDASIIPAVLGGPSEILDLGRKRRFHTKAQRTAIALRDKHCTQPGCDWPPPCATPTTTSHGPKEDPPTSNTPASSAPDTTPDTTDERRSAVTPREVVWLRQLISIVSFMAK